MRRPLSLLTVLALAGGMANATTGIASAVEDPDLRFEMRGVAASAAQARAGDAEQLVSATATFSPANRVTGMPTSTAPQHQIVMPSGSVSVTVDYGYDWETGALTYHYSLATDMAAPDESSSTVVGLGFGVLQGSTCHIEEMASATVYRYITDVLLYDNKDTDDLPSAAGWNCAVLLVGTNNLSETPYDAFVSPLAVTTATPDLTLRAPKKDRLVTGVWTRIPVSVTNASAEGINARDVVVTGVGKGVKVRKLDVGTLDGQGDSEGYVWARLARPRATLKLTLTEKGQALGKASVKLKRRPAPSAPKAGSWSGGDASFTVRGGKVRGFRIVTQTTCGGYPDLPTTTQNTYDFPTTVIPRNNEVVGTQRGNQGGPAAFSAYLDLEFVSSTKVKGSFTYYGPARCRAAEGFTAKLRR